jgi:methyltransferase-like protein
VDYGDKLTVRNWYSLTHKLADFFTARLAGFYSAIDTQRPLHNSILANFIRFFRMKSMVNYQIFARMRVMQRSHTIRSMVNFQTIDRMRVMQRSHSKTDRSIVI